jgi:hypothetical protein
MTHLKMEDQSHTTIRRVPLPSILGWVRRFATRVVGDALN